MACKQERLETYFFPPFSSISLQYHVLKPVGRVMEKKLQHVKGAGHAAAVPVTEAIWSQAEGHRHLPTAVCPKMIRNLADGGWGVE